MGCVLKLHFLPQTRKALEGLRPGSFTRPLPSFGGFHILLREPLERGDFTEILREEFERKTYLDTMRRIQAGTNIVKGP